MELRQFTYVDMVAACGSFTKAAAKLFISQPALSNYIGKVEEEVYVHDHLRRSLLSRFSQTISLCLPSRFGDSLGEIGKQQGDK